MTITGTKTISYTVEGIVASEITAVGFTPDDGKMSVTTTLPLTVPLGGTADMVFSFDDVGEVGTRSYAIAFTCTDTASNFTGNVNVTDVATPAVAPDAIADLAGTNGNTESVLTWTAPNDGGDAIINYNIYQDSVDIGDFAGSPQTITGLTNDTAYEFDVRAVNSIGEALSSNLVTVTPTASTQGVMILCTCDLAVTAGINNVGWGGGGDDTLLDSNGNDVGVTSTLFNVDGRSAGNGNTTGDDSGYLLDAQLVSPFYVSAVGTVATTTIKGLPASIKSIRLSGSRNEVENYSTQVTIGGVAQTYFTDDGVVGNTQDGVEFLDPTIVAGEMVIDFEGVTGPLYINGYTIEFNPAATFVVDDEGNLILDDDGKYLIDGDK